MKQLRDTWSVPAPRQINILWLAPGLLISWPKPMRWPLATLTLLAAACGGPRDGTPQPEPEQFQADTRNCTETEELCLETFPPQCYEVCSDPAPGPAECQESDGDVVLCGDDTCIEGEDESGEVVRVCVGPDCTVSYGAETGEETISCPDT
jgi:hypothetical protein